mgnify:CR=1 FL=1
MKKFSFLLLLSLLSLTASAQDSETPEDRYSVSTNSFWSNWFIQADLAANSFYGDRMNTVQNLSGSPFKGYRTSFGLTASLGKWFTPGLGLRTSLDGFWGRRVVSADAGHNASRFWTLSEHVLFNLSNMVAGYSETRRWNFIPYAGFGLGRNMSRNTYAMGIHLGLLNQWKLSQRLALNLDCSWGISEPDFDGAGGYLDGRGLHTKDQQLSLRLGVTYDLGSKRFQPVPDINTLNIITESQIDALNAQLADEQAENERLRQLLQEKSVKP